MPLSSDGVLGLGPPDPVFSVPLVVASLLDTEVRNEGVHLGLPVGPEIDGGRLEGVVPLHGHVVQVTVDLCEHVLLPNLSHTSLKVNGTLVHPAAVVDGQQHQVWDLSPILTIPGVVPLVQIHSLYN